MMFSFDFRRRVGAGVLAALVLGLVGVSSAQGAFSLENGSVSLTGTDGEFSRQAGAHPDLRVHFDFPFDQASGLLEGNAKDVRLDLPVGMVGDPTVVPQCAVNLLVPTGTPFNPQCPPETQIGIASVSQTPGGVAKVPVYNMEHSPDVPGLFGFDYLTVPIFIQPQVRASDYGISSQSAQISQAKTIYGADITIWGVPADPSHDAQRTDTQGVNPDSLNCFYNNVCLVRSSAPRKPFLSAPTSCSATSATFGLVADSWQNPGVFDTQSFTADINGTPFVTDGCDKLAFAPAVSVRVVSHVADAPTGLDVDLSVPQNDSPDGLSTAHVKRVEVTLPEGMSVSPSSAAGLGACSPAQVGLKTDSPVSCPDSARLGTVEIHTQLLDEPIDGDVFLAKQTDNPFGSLIAMYIVAKGPGFVLKLPGRIDLDPSSGRIVATFDQNPQVPFSKLHLAFRGGSQAALANPPSCGIYNTHVEIVSWASSKSVGLDSPTTIDEGCEARTFSPSFGAGTTTTQAGADAPFTLTVTRADRTQYFSRLAPVTLPDGLLARIGSVDQCGEDQAKAGTCGASSQVGSATTLAGPGAQPLPLTGRVHLTGPYKGAPFGLSIVVPTAGQAGPFDLGNVVVRAAIKIDPTTARASVESDPLPTVIDGIPLRIRQINVTIDRKGFTFNPTSCAAKSVVAGLGGIDSLAPDAATSNVVASSPFQTTGCGALGFKPELAINLTGKGQTTDGKHPTLNAHLVPNSTDANSRRVTVALPLSLALDPGNANGLCEPANAAANKCAASTIVGRATAHSILPHPLTGPVYFVRGERKDPKSGRTIKTLPKLFIPLSADGVTIYINASSNVKDKRLVTTFDTLPDAPFSSFDLQIDGGKHGILAVSGANVCATTQISDARFTGQNDKIADAAITMGTPCALGVVKSSHTSTALKLTVGGVGAGKLSVTGQGAAKASRTIGSATTATLTLRLSKSTRSALAHGRNVRVKVKVLFTPKGAKKARRATRNLLLHGATRR
jgi:hypothetical protein